MVPQLTLPVWSNIKIFLLNGFMYWRRGFALEIWSVYDSADMLFEPDFEGQELSNQCAKPVTWRVNMTPWHTQTWFKGGFTFKVRVTTTRTSDPKCIINDQKLRRNLDDKKAEFFRGNLDMVKTNTGHSYLTTNRPSPLHGNNEFSCP